MSARHGLRAAVRGRGEDWKRVRHRDRQRLATKALLRRIPGSQAAHRFRRSGVWGNVTTVRR